MGRPGFPRTIVEFQRAFPDDEACREYLIACRWPDGYVCPRCGCLRSSVHRKRLLWQCTRCRYQVSVTAGTVLHRTRTGLHLWFWAAYLMATITPGISAVQLQRQLGLSRYETAWLMLHKLRRAMVAPEREPLSREVEVDECLIGGHELGLPGRSPGGKELVVVGVECRGNGSGRVRLSTVCDASESSLLSFVANNVTGGSIVHTDGWISYRKLSTHGYDHQPCNASHADNLDDVLPRVHRVISNLKNWLKGTHRGVSDEHLQVYLDEFTFRFNRRRTPMAAFQTLLGLGTQQTPTTYRQITAAGPSNKRS